MRNLPWAQEYLQDSGHVVPDPSRLRGQWKKHLDTKRLRLEIGCGKGGFAVQMARKNPQEGMVAIELNKSVAALAARRFDESGLDNLLLVHGHAQDLSEWFAPGEVDVIHLNFSDPWPKKRNHKRRLSAPAFLGQYLEILGDQGQVALKSDNAGFFSDSVLQMLEAGFELEALDVDYHALEHEEDAMSEYEKKFVEKGKPIYYSLWKKASKENLCQNFET